MDPQRTGILKAQRTAQFRLLSIDKIPAQGGSKNRMTTDLVPGLARNAEKISRYWDALANPDAINGYSQLIPEAILPELRHEIEESLKPASDQEVAKAVVVVIGSLKIPTNAIDDKEAYFKWMRLALSAGRFPSDIINEVVMRAINTEQWTPSTAKLVETAKHLVEERRRRLLTIARMETEHRRRRQAAADREAEAECEAKRELEREAHRQAELERLRNLEARARKRFGDDGPAPGDVEFADSLSATLVCRAGKRVSWQGALAEGEHWAAQYCRQIALAARVKQALEQGRVSWDEGLAAAKLIANCEASARRRIEDMHGPPAKYRGGPPAETFWRAIWKIAGACGLDTPVFPEDAAAAAINNLKHLTGLADLADARAIIDQQFREDWERQHPNLLLAAPARPHLSKGEQS